MACLLAGSGSDVAHAVGDRVLGVVKIRRVDAPIKSLDEAEDPEREKARGRDAERDPAERLLLQCLKRSAESLGLRGAAMQGGEHEKSADDEEHDTPRAKAEAPGRNRPS